MSEHSILYIGDRREWFVDVPSGNGVLNRRIWFKSASGMVRVKLQPGRYHFKVHPNGSSFTKVA